MPITNVDVKDGNVVIPKGTSGVIVGVQWGDRTGYVVDFAQAVRVLVPEKAMTMEVKNAPKKSLTAKEEKEIGQ